MPKYYNSNSNNHNHKVIEDYIQKNYNFKEKWDKQCSKYDVGDLPSVLPPVDRIIVIGDIHGDMEMTRELLKVAKVINDNDDWIGGNTVVVQVGDQIDRCRPTIDSQCDTHGTTKLDENSDWKILQYFTDLHKKARDVGGAVYSLMGNHELMNVNGDFRYVSYKGIEDFKYDTPYNTILPSCAKHDCNTILPSCAKHDCNTLLPSCAKHDCNTLLPSCAKHDCNTLDDESSVTVSSEKKTYYKGMLKTQNSFTMTSKNKTFSNPTIDNENSFNSIFNFDNDKTNLRKWAFKPGNPISDFLACTRQMAIIIGSNLFVHAGVLPQIAEKYSVTNLNQLMCLYLWNKLESPTTYNEIFLSSDISPLWNRVFGKIGMNQYSKSNLNQPIEIADASLLCSKLLNPLKEIYKIDKIYVGHTPLMDHGISSVCDGKVWLTDFGASKAFDKFDTSAPHRSEIRKAQVLEILKDGEIINILK